MYIWNMSEKSEQELLQDLIIKSEDDFEKKILYIGAGALLLSLTLLEKIIQLEYSSGIYFLIAGWVFIVSSLLINLSSHLISKLHLRKAQQELDDNIAFGNRLTNHKRRVFIVECFNWSSAGTLIIGILLILFFASINAMHPHITRNQTGQQKDTISIRIINSKQYPMTPEKNNPKIKNEVRTPPRPTPDTEKKGYTPMAPRQETPDPKPVEQPSKPVNSED